jgi:hypothetical protein
MLLALISRKNFSNPAKIETIKINDLQKKIQLESQESRPSRISSISVPAAEVSSRRFRYIVQTTILEALLIYSPSTGASC